MTMKDTKRSTAFLITACFLALAGFGAAQSAPSNPSVLDELMPRPVKVETAAAGETPVVPVAPPRWRRPIRPHFIPHGHAEM
jgi:hypothetical protein